MSSSSVNLTLAHSCLAGFAVVYGAQTFISVSEWLAIRPYCASVQSRLILILRCSLRLIMPSCVFRSGFLTIVLCVFRLVLLVWSPVFCEEYKLWISSLRSFLSHACAVSVTSLSHELISQSSVHRNFLSLFHIRGWNVTGQPTCMLSLKQ
jgi:hypothetical protein